MILPLIFFIIGLIFLIKGGDWFVDGATGIAHRFHVPELLIGATVVSIGTTLPEVMVSATSAVSGPWGNRLWKCHRLHYLQCMSYCSPYHCHPSVSHGQKDTEAAGYLFLCCSHFLLCNSLYQRTFFPHYRTCSSYYVRCLHWSFCLPDQKSSW